MSARSLHLVVCSFFVSVSLYAQIDAESGIRPFIPPGSNMMGGGGTCPNPCDLILLGDFEQLSGLPTLPYSDWFYSGQNTPDHAYYNGVEWVSFFGAYLGGYPLPPSYSGLPNEHYIMIAGAPPSASPPNGNVEGLLFELCEPLEENKT